MRTYHEVAFVSHGDPASVLQYHSTDSWNDHAPPAGPRPHDTMVRVELWHAPWNPADRNEIQGTYASPYLAPDPIRDGIRNSSWEPSRRIAGSEGWGIVTDISSSSSQSESSVVQVGDVVTVGQPGMGTFRSSFWAPSTSVIPLTRGLELKAKLGSGAATLPQLGGTALRMLMDFVTLQHGDVILQNAGNSGVGVMVSQLAKTLPVDTFVVSLVRRGTRTLQQWTDLQTFLTTTAKCDMVVAEEDLTDKDAIRAFQADLRRYSSTGQTLPVLALNAVGGDSSSLLTKCLNQGGTMVTYGGMSQRPVTTSTSQFIFRDIRLRGYWHSRWMAESDWTQRTQLYNHLVDAVLSKGVTCPPVQEFPLAKVHDALIYDSNQSNESVRRKVVFQCQQQQQLE